MKTRSTFQAFALISTAIAASLSLISCQRRTSVVIEASNPLRFVVSGPGTLTNLQLSGPDLEREPNRQGDGERLTLLKVYWELAQHEGQERSLDQIGQITYGTVPEGFIQVQPVSGTPPPQLVERDLYNITLSVKDGHGINNFFTIRDGKVISEGEQ